MTNSLEASGVRPTNTFLIVSCNDREAAEAVLDQLLLMTATFFDDIE